MGQILALIADLVTSRTPSWRSTHFDGTPPPLAPYSTSRPSSGRLSGAFLAAGLFLEGELEQWENGAEFEARELGDGGREVAPRIGWRGLEGIEMLDFPGAGKSREGGGGLG